MRIENATNVHPFFGDHDHPFNTADYYYSKMLTLENQPKCIFVDGATLDEAEYRISPENIEILRDWSKTIGNKNRENKHPEKGQTNQDSSLKCPVSENASKTSSPNKKESSPSKISCIEKDDEIFNSLSLTNNVVNDAESDQLNNSWERLSIGERIRSRRRKCPKNRRKSAQAHHGQYGSRKADKISWNGEIHSTLDGVQGRKLSKTTDLDVEIFYSNIPVVDLSKEKEEIQKYFMKLKNTSHGDKSNFATEPFATEVSNKEHIQKSNFGLNDDPPMLITTQRHSIPQRLKKRKRQYNSNVTSKQKIQKLSTVADDSNSDCFSKATEASKMSLTEAVHQEDSIDKIQSYANEDIETTEALILDGAKETESNIENTSRESFSENNMETIAWQKNKHEINKTEMVKTSDESSFRKNKLRKTNLCEFSQEKTTLKNISTTFSFILSKYKKLKTSGNGKIKMHSKLIKQNKEAVAKTPRKPSNGLKNSCSVIQRTVKRKNTYKSQEPFSKSSKSVKRKKKNIVSSTQSTQTDEHSSSFVENSSEPCFIPSDSQNPSLVKNTNTTNPGMKSCTDCEKRKSLIKWVLTENRVVDCPECEIDKLCMRIISSAEKVYECGKQKANNLEDETWQLLTTAIDCSKYLAHFCHLCTISLTDLKVPESFYTYKLPISSDNLISVTSKESLISVPSIDNIKSDSDNHNVKPDASTDAVKSDESTDTVKSHESTDTVKSDESTDTVKSDESTDTLKPLQNTDAVKSDQSTDTLKSDLSTDAVKSDQSIDTVRPPISYDGTKPPTMKDKLRSLSNGDRESRKEDKGDLNSDKNKNSENMLSVTEIVEDDCVVIEVLPSPLSKNSMHQSKTTLRGLHVPGPFLNTNSIQHNYGRYISNHLPNGQFIHNSNIFPSQVLNEPRCFNVRNGTGSGGHLFIEHPPGISTNETIPMANGLGSTRYFNPVLNSTNKSNSLRNVSQDNMNQRSQRSQQPYSESEQLSQSSRDFDTRSVRSPVLPYWKINKSHPNYANLDSHRAPLRYNEISTNFGPARVNNYSDITEGYTNLNTQFFRRKAGPPSHDRFMNRSIYNQITLNRVTPNRRIQLEKNLPPFIAMRQNSLTGNVGSLMMNTNNSGSSTAGKISHSQASVDLLPMNANTFHKKMPLADNIPNHGFFFQEDSLIDGSLRHNIVSANEDLTVLNADNSRISAVPRATSSVEHSAYNRHMEDKGNTILERCGVCGPRRSGSSSRKNPAPRRVINNQKSATPESSTTQNSGTSDNNTTQILGSFNKTTTQNPGSSDNTTIQNPGSSILQNLNASPTVDVNLPTSDSLVPDITVDGNSRHRQTSCN